MGAGAAGEGEAGSAIGAAATGPRRTDKLGDDPGSEPGSKLLKSRRRRRVLIGLGLALGAGLFAAMGPGRVPLLVGLARWLDVGVEPRPADAVFILPGGPMERPYVAAALIKAGYAPIAVTPMTERSAGEEDGLEPPTSELTRRVLLARGVPESAIVILPRRSSSTREDAFALKTYLEANPDARALAVTTLYHTRRARWIFRNTMGQMAARVDFISAPSDYFDPASWWRHPASVRILVNEYAKFFYYAMRYGAGRGVLVLVFAAGALALLWRRLAAAGRTGVLRFALAGWDRPPPPHSKIDER